VPTTNVNQEFTQALMRKDHAQLQKSLSQGADFETLMPVRLVDPFQKALGYTRNVTPLKYAAANGDLRSVNLIYQYLKNKYSPTWGIRATWNYFFGLPHATSAARQRNIDGKNDFSFLHAAVQGGNLDVVKKAIIESKIKPNESYITLKDTMISPKEPYNLTPLTLATILGHRDIITYLIESGAKHEPLFYLPNKNIDHRALSPLCYAASQDNLSMVQFLLEHNAKLDGNQGHLCWTALQYAAACNAEKTAKYILQKTDVQETELAQALLFASNAGHQEMVMLLLEKGTNPFKVEPVYKMSAVGCAASKKNIEILKTIISGYKPNIRYEEPFPNPEDLEEGQNIRGYDNAKDFFYRHGDKLRFARALQLNDISELKSILNNFNRPIYFSIDDTFENGNTSLHIACLNQSLDVVRYLLSKGANPNVMNDNGETPLMLAIQKEPKSELIVKALLNQGANLNNPDLQNKTALMYAAEKGQDNIFDLLIETPGCPINVSSTDRQGNTLFLLAAASGSFHCTTKAMELGANPNDKNRNNENAIILAAQTSRQVALTRHLIKHGIEIDSKNNKQKTAFQVALEQENLDLCTTLVAARLLFLIANKQINSLDNAELDFLFSQGASVRQHDSLQRSLFQVAMLSKNTNLVEYLVDMADYIEDETNLTTQQKKRNYKYDIEDIKSNVAALIQLAKSKGKESLANKLVDIVNRGAPVEQQAAPAITHSYNATNSRRNTTSRKTKPRQASSSGSSKKRTTSRKI